MRERAYSGTQASLVGMHDQLEAEFRSTTIAKRDHLLELPGRVDVEEREWRPRRPKGLHCEMQHDRAVLADRIQHDRSIELRYNLAHDVDTLCFQQSQTTCFRNQH